MKQTNAQAALAGLMGAKGRNTAPAVIEGIDFTAPGEIESFPVSKLIEHPDNKRLFNPLEGADFERLKADIEKNGIHDALIVTKENVEGVRVILAGHNRLRAARELGLKFVPVRVKVFSEKTEETRFIIRDNLHRRQLKPEQVKALIVELYGEEIGKDGRGGDRGNQYTGGKVAKVNNELLPKGKSSKPVSLAGRVSKDLGISESRAKQHLATIRNPEGKTARPTPKQPRINAQEAPHGTQKGQGGQVHPGQITDAGKAFLEVTTDYLIAVRKLRGISKKDTDYALKKISATFDALS